MLKHGVPMACVLAAASLSLPARGEVAADPDTNRPLVTGAFVQLNEESASAEPAWWRRRIGEMCDVGMDTLVIQYAGYGDRYFYPTGVQGAQANEVDCLESILAAADERQTHVFLGLQLNDKFWDGAFDPQANFERNRDTLMELHDRYGAHPSLAGWYVPEEVSDHTQRKPEFASAVLEYIGRISELAHRTTDLPVMISPYFGQQPDAQAYAQWWDETALPKTHVDILAMQDGVGTHRTTIEESRPVYEALAPVLKRHGVAFWANNESFDQTHGWPVDDQAWSARAVDFKTFMRQVRSTAPFTTKIITFEFTNYLNPQTPGRPRDLYEAYRAYYQTVMAVSPPPIHTSVKPLPRHAVRSDPR